MTEKIKPSAQDFADANLDAGGPLPSTATKKQMAERYRLAQMVALMKLAGYVRLPDGSYKLPSER